MSGYTIQNRNTALAEFFTIVPPLVVFACDNRVFDAQATDQQKAFAFAFYPGAVAWMYGVLQTIAKEVTMPWFMASQGRKETRIGKIQEGGFKLKALARFFLRDIVCQSAYRSFSPRVLLYYGANLYASIMRRIPSCEIGQGNHTQIYNQTYETLLKEQCPQFPEGCHNSLSYLKHAYVSLPLQATLFLWGIFCIKLLVFRNVRLPFKKAGSDGGKLYRLDQIFDEKRDGLQMCAELKASFLYQVIFSVLYDFICGVLSCADAMLWGTVATLSLNLVDRFFSLTSRCFSAKESSDNAADCYRHLSK